MDNYNTNIGKLIYRAEIKYIDLVEYGISLESLSSGENPIPSAGARFDRSFQGILNGPVLKGLVDGTDFLYIRPDRTFHTHLHGRIITAEGIRIAVSSEGVSLHQNFSDEALLRSSVTLFTSSEPYLWLNRLQLWSVGSMDLAQGAASLRSYSV